VNIYIYLYEDFVEFEVVFAAMFTTEENIVMVAQEKRLYRGTGKFNCMPDKVLKDIDPDQVDLFIIPGGDYKIARKDDDLKPLLLALHEKNKLIAGICGGSMILADHGLLKNRNCTGNSEGIDLDNEEMTKLYNGAKIVNDGVVVDGHLITASGQNYLEFACELELLLGLNTKAIMRDDYKYWKNHNSPWEEKLYKNNISG
jgi:putative intracellular protease/amidase